MDGSNFMEKRIDPLLRMTFIDLARTLAKIPQLEVDFAYHSYFDFDKERMTVSFYWDRLLDKRKIDGMKTDIYLSAFGQRHFTDPVALQLANQHASSASYPNFRKQFTALIEEFRLIKKVCHLRPGMSQAFQNRLTLLIHFYRERFRYHLSHQQWLDALFCAFYLRLAGRPVGLSGPLTDFSDPIRQSAHATPGLRDTFESVRLAKDFANLLPETFHDMTASYYTLRGHTVAKAMENPVQHANPLASEKTKTMDEKDNRDTHEDKLPTWHQEQEQDGQNFLQFDLDEGTKTDLLGKGERRMESGDQAFASVQGEGASRANDHNRFDELPSQKENRQTNPSQAGDGIGGGGINQKAKALDAILHKPTLEEKQLYAQMAKQVNPEVKTLKRSLEKWLEHKQVAPKGDLHIGRLGKKLTRLITDDAPRLFYKKHAEDKTFDAAFSLLIDCSASMHDKMADVQLGVTLFHESLRAMNIPHAVTGFWEDALSSDTNSQPNYFLKVIDFDHSLLPDAGSHLLQLEPQEDNRDGFAIRTVVKHFSQRPESHKWLLVFTDGEPSAFGYTDGGILDTHEAVREARKKGINVIGVFLTGGETAEDELETMKEIYGRDRLIIPNVSDIPLYITPMLRKLLKNST